MLLVFVVCVILGISYAQYVPMRHHKYYPPRFLQAQGHYRYYSLFPQEEDHLNNYHCVKLCFAYLLPQYVPRNVYQCYSNFDCPKNHLCSFNEDLQHGTCVLLRRHLHDFEAQGGVAPPLGHPNERPSEFNDIITCSRDMDCPPNAKCVNPGICAFLASSLLSESVGSGDHRLKRDEQDDDNDEDLIFDDDNYYDGRRWQTLPIGGFFCGRTGLFLLVTGYALLGALLFKTLEGGVDGNVPVHIQRSREDCLRELWLITERLNVLYEKNWTRLVTEQLKRFERIIIESGKTGNSSNATAPHWTFGGALLYTFTLLTTIGYGRLSPKTAIGKIIAMFYALIGVPLMLILLSLLGSMLANGVKRIYWKLCCKQESSKAINSVVGYHRAPSSPTGKHSCKSTHDDCTIQIMPHNSYKHADHQEVPKRAILATVRASHSRGRCRQGQVRQMLTDSHVIPPHPHGTPSRSVPGSLTTSDVEEAEDTEDSEHSGCVHDTPSRVPLIYRPENARIQNLPHQSSPTVPATLVFIIFSVYVCIGASAFASARGWHFLDAVYFCFVALSTIGVSDVLPQTPDFHTQAQLFACCIYLFLGLIIVAMCFSLVQEEVAHRCKQFAVSIGLARHN